MGPIERELRESRDVYGLLTEAFAVCRDAAIDRGWYDEFVRTQNVDADVMSEAIEAAEALGL
jgi:hypothetical protein